ncbi:MAG: DHH family phosphoesterase [Candidatus Nanoarchaeia archaeon]|jgi:single-stranded DNA-specific DHH superfamily exonuclease
MDKLKQVEKWVNNSTIVDIICHTDSDGLTAAAQLVNYLKKHNVGYNIILGSPERLRHANFWRKIKNDLVFFVDIPADHEKEELIKLSNKANIVIIDHHTIMNDMNSDSIIHFHREGLGEKRYYPASKMVYDLLGGIDWMACIGVIGDYGGKPWKEFINKTHEKFNFPKCADENCFDSPFTKYDHLINSARMIYGDKGCIKAVNILINSKDWDEFKEKSTVLEEWDKIIDDYINFVKSDYEYNKKYYKEAELLIYDLISPKYKIGSALATIVSSDTPNKTVVIIIHKENVINVNLRRQDSKYDLSHLAKQCVKGLNASGGGHREAAGASLKKKNLDEFKECLINTLTKWVKDNS